MFMDRRVFVNAPTGSPKFPRSVTRRRRDRRSRGASLEALDALVKHDETIAATRERKLQWGSFAERTRELQTAAAAGGAATK
jgi:hypothetical protein